GYWDHSKKFQCPMCKKSYTRRPELSINRVLAEISSQFQGLDVGVTTPNTKAGASHLGKWRLELKHLIKERAKKLEEINQSIRVIKSSAQRELEDSWQVYAELQSLVEQSQAELVELIGTRQREAERHAQELVRGLEDELSQLRKRSGELDALAQNQDKVIFLKSLPTLAPLPEPINWSGEVYLDPGTAQRNLVLSEDGRQVMYEEQKHNQSEGTRRFSPALFVIAREGHVLWTPLLGGRGGPQDCLDCGRDAGVGTPEGRDKAEP
ncbi:unnamed protein product, partial [Coregonus sp. 'balchen']